MSLVPNLYVHDSMYQCHHSLQLSDCHFIAKNAIVFDIMQHIQDIFQRNDPSNILVYHSDLWQLI